MDRAKAGALARSVNVAQEDWKHTVRALERIPDRAAAVKRDSQRGVPCTLEADDVEHVLLGDWLEACGAAHLFDVETDTFPNAHDGLLAQLAMLGGEAWRDVVFEEIPPPEDDARAPYRLTAYGWGRRFDVNARNHGDWYDLDAVVGLLNDMAADHKLSMRWVVLGTGGQEALVVAGDEAWLKQAWQDGLLNPVGPGNAEQTGKAFEDLVRQKLEDGELRLGE